LLDPIKPINSPLLVGWRAGNVGGETQLRKLESQNFEKRSISSFQVPLENLASLF